ncbi:hypothetical protein I4U23_016223 [Adineta vaga]|nr:hypothetical protein I4U23_016223 [Adineta vaga]
MDQKTLSNKYLEQSQKLPLNEDTIVKPLQMQLNTLQVERYRQFFRESSPPSTEQVNQTFVLEFTESLTVLVGPNNSGKSSLLKALELFCKAVRQGSGTYDHKQTKELLGIDEDLSEVILQGTFTVHYQGSPKTKRLDTTTRCSEGVLKCLSMIIAICCADPHSIVIIDEPDAHVFPNAQQQLIKYFYHRMADLRRSNLFCQMIITTHSTDIMQAAKIEHIRQIFVNPSDDRPIGIRSLAGTRHLFEAMGSLGMSLLSHGEFVRLGVHKKVLILENRSDYDFLRGLINRSKPALLNSSFTVIDKRG